MKTLIVLLILAIPAAAQVIKNTSTAISPGQIVSNEGSCTKVSGGDITCTGGQVGIGTASPTSLFQVAASSFAVTSAGATTVNAGIGATGLTVNGAANQWSSITNGSGTTGQSFGPRVIAGSNSSDVAYEVRDYTGANTYFKVRGDGNVGINNTANLANGGRLQVTDSGAAFVAASTGTANSGQQVGQMTWGNTSGLNDFDFRAMPGYKAAILSNGHTTPDILVDLSGQVSVAGPFNPAQKTIAQLAAITPAVGDVYSCSNCTLTYDLVVGTGAVIEGFRESGTNHGPQ